MPLLRIAQVAELLDVSVARAYELARVGVLPTVKIGRQLRIDPDQLDQWISAGGQSLPGGWRREPSDG